MTFTIFDLIVFLVIIISSLLGLYRGFIYIVLHFIGFVSSIILAILLYPFARDILSPYINNDLGLSIASGTGIYILTLVTCSLIMSKIISLCDSGNKSIFNRLLGLVIGFLRGLLFTTIIFVIVTFVTKDSKEEDLGMLENALIKPKSPDWLANSKSTIYLQKVVKYSLLILPEDIVKSINLLGNEGNQLNEEDAIDAINRRKKNDVKSFIEVPTSDDLKDSIEEVTP